MSYLAPYLDSSGLHLPTYDDVLQYMLTEYKRIFGQDVYLGQDTQDYQLLSLYASMWDDMATVVIDTYNARNVNWAYGTQLDSIVSLSGIRRLSQTYSSVTLTLTGTAGTTLQAGMRARDNNGYSWALLTGCTFDTNGSATVQARCTQAGCINADAGTITTCQTPVYNWTGVTNASPAVPGNEQESDAQLRQRRAKSLYGSSLGSTDAIVSALRNIDNVTGVRVLQNNTGETDANGIPAHSIMCIVQNGSPADIAKTIYFVRAPGVGTHGTTSYTYQDQWGQNNVIKFSRPVQKSIAVRVDITALAGYDSVTTTGKIKQVIKEYIEGLDIGANLTVPYLYAQAYSVNGTGTPTFVVTALKADNKTSTVQADCNSRFVVSNVEVNVT